jgi:uncharacterized repeat protein (TIGR02543 family)
VNKRGAALLVACFMLEMVLPMNTFADPVPTSTETPVISDNTDMTPADGEGSGIANKEDPAPGNQEPPLYSLGQNTSLSTDNLSNTNVAAKISRGGATLPTDYTTLDAAVGDAIDGDTIILKQDCELAAVPQKSVAFVSDSGALYSITCRGTTQASIGANKTLTMDHVNFVWNATPNYLGPWPGNYGTMLCMESGSTLNLINTASCTLSYDSASTKVRCAIYHCLNANVLVNNGSQLNIIGNSGSAVVSSGIQTDTGGNVVVSGADSCLRIDGMNRGISGSLDIIIQEQGSKFIVQNCTANATNGGNYTFTNATATFENNRGHGFSCTSLTANASTINAINNDFCGIVGYRMAFDNSTVNVLGNNKALCNSAFRILSSTGNCIIQSNCTVNISRNYKSGISIDESGARMEMLAGTVTGNGIDSVNGTPSEKGGGVYTAGAFTMGPNVRIYGNHAAAAGDDIYCESTGSISLENMPTGCKLSDGIDIDGWYYDGYGDTAQSSVRRWNDADDIYYCSPYSILQNDSREIALKAAHTGMRQISYDLAGGENAPAFSPVTVRCLTEFTLQGTPSRSGHSFSGWTLDGAPAALNTIYVVKKDLHFVAQWTAIPAPTATPEPPATPAETPTAVPAAVPTRAPAARRTLTPGLIAAPTPAATPAPTATPQISETIENGDTPRAAANAPAPEGLSEDKVPLNAAPNNAAWALINLILMLLTAGSCLFMLVRAVLGKRRVRSNRYAEDQESSYEVKFQQYDRKTPWKLFSVVPAVIAIIVFVLTENMSLPMILIDKWTLLMAIIALAQMVVIILAKRGKEKPESSEE